MLINALLGQKGNGDIGFWIGMKKDSERVAQWIDNSELSYANFDLGQPSSYSVSVCSF